MIAGLSLEAFTVIHVLITFVAIGTGFPVVFGLIGSHRLPKTTAIFWVFTVLTSVTGFMFFLSPSVRGFSPATATGVLAAIVFLFGLFALYVKYLYGAWRWVYVVAAVMSLYLNVFVLIVQTFEKVKLINPAAPMVGPPFAEPQQFQFAVSQIAVLVIFVMLGIVGAIKFRRGPGLV
jgi:hypothetical protein